MSLSQLQSRAQPSEALFATRIEDQQGVLKAVVLMLNKQEVSRIPLTADWCRSFVLLWSALVGKLQAIDIGYLKRDLTTWYWASWPEVVEYLRQHLSTLPPDQVSVLHANVISHIPIKDVSDAVRSLLASDQRAFVDLVNGDSTPLSKGKVVLSGFWFKMAVAAWAAKHQKKTLSWPLAVTDTWAPLGGFSDKVLERAIRDHWPNVSGAIPRDIVSSGSAGASGSSQPSHSGPEVAGPPEPSGPVGKAPAAPSLPADDAALLTMPQLLLKTTEKTRDLPPESIKTAVGQLNTLLAPYPSMHRLGQQLLKLSDALSLSACLTSYSWPTGGDLPRIKCALVAWSRYIEEAGLITITDAVKSQHLLEILQAVRDGADSTTSWRSLACEVAMDLLKLDDDELPLFQLEAVKDFPSMALHLSEYVSRIKQLSTLKALRDIVQARCRRLASPDWATAVLQQMGVPLASAVPSAAPSLRPLPSPGDTELVPVRMNLNPVAEGLPWPAFVAAASAYFRCEVHGPHQPNGLASKGTAVKFCFLLLPMSAWRTIRAAVPPVQISMGPSGLVATITDTHPDGSSIKPWSHPGLCLTRQWLSPTCWHQCLAGQ